MDKYELKEEKLNKLLKKFCEKNNLGFYYLGEINLDEPPLFEENWASEISFRYGCDRPFSFIKQMQRANKAGKKVCKFLNAHKIKFDYNPYDENKNYNPKKEPRYDCDIDCNECHMTCYLSRFENLKECRIFFYLYDI